MKTNILLAFTLFLALHLGAQQTGSFSLNITFDEPDYSMSNELALYVPTDYDAGIDYPLIVGFRGGPHTGPDHLRDQLQPLSDSLGAIIMCPESVSLWQNGQEDLVKPLFQYALDTTAALYSIDMTRIYVTGLSFGGRHTVLVAMDTDSGPINPGLRGIIPFAAGMNAQTVADYGVDTSAPICTCIGSDDATFYAVSETLHTSATAAGHNTLFNEVPGVGHTMDFPTFIEEMMECFEFIEAQYTTALIEEQAFEFEILPNPSSDYIRVNAPVSISTRYILSDVRGVELKVINGMPSVSQRTIDVSDLPAGQYLITVVIDEIRSSQGIIQGSRVSQWFIKE